MKKSLLPLMVAAAFPFATTNAHASAFALAEQGASGLGNAYAGAAAVAEDASTVWWNPAGMSRLGSGKHLAFAGHVIMPSTKFSRGTGAASAALQPTGSDGGDAGSTAFVPNIFFAMDINPKWSFGVGVNVPFGLATEYSDDWIGRFQGIKSEVKTLNINPSASYKLSDHASIGFGVSWQQGEIELRTAASAGAAGEARNQVNVDGDAWGFNIGALFDVSPATRVGIAYRSSLDYSMKGDSTFSQVPAAAAANPGFAPASVTIDLETPASASVSVAHKANDRLELLADITWTEWSKISRLPLNRTSGPLAGTPLDTLLFNFDDTWRVSAGLNYKYGGPWTLKAGVAFDQSPVPSAELRSVRLPDNDRYWLSVGATYKATATSPSRFDAGLSYIMIKDADINNNGGSPATKGTVVGTYQANVVVLSLQYQYSF